MPAYTVILAAATLETILIFDVPVLLTTAATLGVALIGMKAGKRMEPKVHAIDEAVNNQPANGNTIRENVQELADGTKP
jgi:hypothetical protein